MSGITTHILDTSAGRPAAGVPVTLSAAGADGRWEERTRARTDDDGRARLHGPDSLPAPGDYRLTFEVADYLAARAADVFYPRVEVHFTLSDPAEHYHVPLLLSPFGYSTYRGS
ncbi:MAG: hydroxyisourate hydrolase [Gemmatimonadota bacterium]